jgi:hypothetical protein
MLHATPSVSSSADWQGICSTTQHQLNPANCLAGIEGLSTADPDSLVQLILAEHLVAAMFLGRPWL